jgi:uncharacterized protein YfaS (alpha-2-macroglobulin family)
MLTPVRKLEALNEGLNATMDVSYDAWGYEGYRQFYWEEYGYNYKEIRGDRVVFFITYPGPGTHTFTYFARVTTPGTFAALPAQVHGMYDLALWGRSAGNEIEVK